MLVCGNQDASKVRLCRGAAALDWTRQRRDRCIDAKCENMAGASWARVVGKSLFSFSWLGWDFLLVGGWVLRF